VTRLSSHVLGALVALALVPGLARAEGPVVKEIKVEGNRRVEAAAITAVVTQKKDEPLDPKKVDQDVRAIMKLGFFSDVRVEEEGPKDAPVLVYVVAERPTVHEAKIVGNEQLSKDDLKDTVDLKPFAPLDLAQVRKDLKKIQEKYVEKGFFLADVTHEIKELPDNQVDVIYRVNERAKVMVKEVRFVGNHQVPKEDLTPYMQTQEGNLLSLVSSAGTYKEEAFQHDLQGIQAVYLDKGYVEVKVGKPAISLSPDRRWLYVTIPVEEGEQYTIGKIGFAGDLMNKEPELRSLLQTRSGELFSRTKVGADLFAIGDVFKDLGYAYANVSPNTHTDPARRIVDLEFEVQPGPRVKFERIEIVGNDKTRDKVIRRELRIYEGELYSGTGVKVSKQRVTALGFFETVEITTKKGSAEDKIVATVEVKEKATGTFQVGAGFSSYENFILTGQISQNNFFGWGQTLSLQVQWSSVRQLGQIQFVEPYFLDTRWTFAFDLYATEGYYTTFTRRAIGGSLTWGYELSGLARWWAFAQHLEDYRLFATYTNERVNASAATTVIYPNQFKSGTTSSLRLSLQADKRDNRLFPTRGYYLSASVDLAPPFLAPSSIFGNEVNLFTKWTVDGRFYHPILFGVIFRSRLSFGYIANWDPAKPIPISELYYVGGIQTIRGYRFLSISPTVQVANALVPGATLVPLAIGGDKQVVINLELEFPIAEKVGVRGLLFADAGNSFRGSLHDSTVPLSLYKSVGFGFRWFSPMGPLRFEWGIPLNRRRNESGTGYLDNPVDFQFTIGSFF